MDLGIKKLTSKNQDYWAFRKNAKREYSHALFQYPAMMVPKLQREFLKEFCEIDKSIEWVYDPFVGSGTMLTEAMLKGLNFCGNDINPLAVLLCKVKEGPFFIDKLNGDINSVNAAIENDNDDRIEIDFPGIEKWFREDVAINLSLIQRNIKSVPSLYSRRFFWIALAEAVKLSCNSRTTTYKLHIRPEEEVNNREIDPIYFFRKALERNFNSYKQQAITLKSNGFLKKGRYKFETKIILHDTSKPFPGRTNRFDLLMTSPPYGDNATTVPYGQYSYLPLRWIDMSDIDVHAGSDFLTSTHEIDSRSLGGKRSKAFENQVLLERKSPTLRKVLKKLRNEPKDRSLRILAFCRDMDKCLNSISNNLKDGSYLIWTLGNRCVGGKVVPLDKILSEFMNEKKINTVESIYRTIPSKRMAIKNNFAKTISKETILILQKAK